jgi:hypothetical protein
MKFARPLLGIQLSLCCLALMKSLPDGFHANIENVVGNAYQTSLNGLPD